MYLRISYTHDANSPHFPGNPENRVEPVLALGKGDACNAAKVCLFNHNGTHIDLPRHYLEHGRCLVDYDIAEFIFRQPGLIRLKADPGQAIHAGMLKIHEEEIWAKDLLLLRTGCGSYRNSTAYTDNPYLSLDAAEFLRSMPRIRAIGIDFLSVTNPRFRMLGDEVHKTLLGDDPDEKPVLIIEDLDLSSADIIERFHRIFVVPLFVNGVDGMPCTVFGEYAA